MTDDDRLGDMLSTDHEPSADEVIAKSLANLAELDQLRAEWAALTPEQQAQAPETLRRFFDTREPTP